MLFMPLFLIFCIILHTKCTSLTKRCWISSDVFSPWHSSSKLDSAHGLTKTFIFAQQPLPYFPVCFLNYRGRLKRSKFVIHNSIVPMPFYNDFMISLFALSILDVSSEAR